MDVEHKIKLLIKNALKNQGIFTGAGEIAEAIYKNAFLPAQEILEKQKKGDIT